MRELLSDRNLVAEILESARDASAAFGRPDLPPPDEGFAASAAFDAASPLAGRLCAEHDAAMRDLYYGTEQPPTFDDVLAQVHADAELLAVG